MTTLHTQQTIAPFYRLYFTILDPISLILTSIGLLLSPDFMLSGIAPPPNHIINQHHVFLLHQLAILYLFMGLLMFLVPRTTPDLRVWRVLIGCVLFVDVSLVISTLVTLRDQGRLASPETWRWQDWGFTGYNLFVATIRTLFMAGAGVDDGVPTDVIKGVKRS
jgi:hypothetical protein